MHPAQLHNCAPPKPQEDLALPLLEDDLTVLMVLDFRFLGFRVEGLGSKVYCLGFGAEGYKYPT